MLPLHCAYKCRTTCWPCRAEHDRLAMEHADMLKVHTNELAAAQQAHAEELAAVQSMRDTYLYMLVVTFVSLCLVFWMVMQADCRSG